MLMTVIHPRFHHRYSSLPIFGPILEGYASWLIDKGYSKPRVRRHFQSAKRLVCRLQEKDVHGLEELTRENLRACAPACSQDDANLTVLIRLIEQYLEDEGVFPVPPLTGIEIRLAAYRTYLEDVRGLAPSTVVQHNATIAGFLEHLGYEKNSPCLDTLTGVDIESFIGKLGKRFGRASLQHSVAHLRAFLRFLGIRDGAPPDLDLQIDTPRVYRGERLPQALSWDTVSTLLQSIDRSTIKGRRDYAMLLLMATYGLRSCEVVTLTLDDIQWRVGLIRIPQQKSANHLLLPLTDEVGAGLVDYLQQGRPALPYREVFLRCRTPDGVLKPTAVTEVFQAWSRKSGLAIPFQGAHCIRHSYAVHLLRQGTPLKTIGDILGHRSAESTCVYLRLAIEDLRSVALPLPKVSTADKQREDII